MRRVRIRSIDTCLRPMVTPQVADFDSIPVNARAYLRKHGERLDMIRNEVNNNVVISQENMLERANEKMQPLSISIGDLCLSVTSDKWKGTEITKQIQRSICRKQIY